MISSVFPFTRPVYRNLRTFYDKIFASVVTPLQRILTPIRVWNHHNCKQRRLEIGPGEERIQGFKTLNVVGGRNVDYVLDAGRPLPFRDGAFEIIYASHILEHIPWYKTEDVLKEWVRLLSPGGALEIWVPDGLKICRAFVEAEQDGSADFKLDGWFRFNESRDPCVWASGRIFSYGDGTGTTKSPNWHWAVFSERYLIQLFERLGLTDVRRLDTSEVRGYDHGWINLGIRGTKRE